MNYLAVFTYLAVLVSVTTSQTTQAPPNTPEGALISTHFTGEVGYNLDEIPDYALDDAKQYVTSQVTDEQWIARAKMQIFATIYRQVFRVYYYGPRLQLTLPPKEVWHVHMTSDPIEKQIQGHSYIVRTYSFHSVLLGTASSVSASEPALNEINGIFSDIFIAVSYTHLTLPTILRV